GEHARDRHHAVGGLVVLVEADAVEAELVGKLHLIEVFVIEACAFLGVVVLVRIGHPGGAMLLYGLEIGMPIRHQMEVEDLHAAALRFSRNPSSGAMNACRCSTCGM